MYWEKKAEKQQSADYPEKTGAERGGAGAADLQQARESQQRVHSCKDVKHLHGKQADDVHLKETQKLFNQRETNLHLATRSTKCGAGSELFSIMNKKLELRSKPRVNSGPCCPQQC